ncbi:MAG: chorismate mutase [Spirochaetia bacterium]|nr:chorismate mutase [Spirochaetia bacterium]
MKKLYALRGATQLHIDTKEEMRDKVTSLINTLYEINEIVIDDVVTIQFTITSDLHALNPATAYRERCKKGEAPLFCSSEPDIDGMLEKTVRVMILLYRDEDEKKLIPVYQEGTQTLRKDLFEQ